MGIFDNIGSAEFYAGGKYVTPGLYLAEILKVKQGLTRNKRAFFVVEMKVLETSNEKDHQIGTEMSWMVMVDQDAALGNIRHFLSVAADTPFSEVTKEDGEEAVGEGNPLAGVRVRVMAVNIKTRANKDFTKVKFISAATSSEDAQRDHAKELAAAPSASVAASA
jgi:hypothetical protein